MCLTLYMSEFINAYDVDRLHILTPMDRAVFYNEQVKIYKETGEIKKMIEIVNIILFNEVGELIIQKRASVKKHNPWLLDKSIWWHVNTWDSPDYTVMIETVQELQVPSIVLKTETEFAKTYALLQNYIKTIAIIKHIWTIYYTPKKLFDWELIPIWNFMHLYMGLYWWRTKNVDREAKWLLFYSLEDLKKEIKEYPTLFTDDLKLIIELYEKEISSFIKFILNHQQ